jgi:hypothetical protein
MLPNAGTPSSVHLKRAGEIRDALSERLQDALHDALGASAVIYALLLSEDNGVRGRQLDFLTRKAGQPVRDEMLRLEHEIQNLPRDHRLPLIDLAIAGLRQLSPKQYFQFKEIVDALVRMDGSISLFEYALQSVVLHHLSPQFEPPPRKVIEFYSFKPLVGDATVLLSALAYLGSDHPTIAQAAFERGAALVMRATRSQVPILARSKCTLDLVDASLKRLCRAVPQIKKNVLHACALTVAADGKLDRREAELLRAIAATLDCPLPPFVA